ncbi:MAG: polyphosphate kinase 2 family protein [Candidatus Limnocylindrales bacterium]
MTTPLVGSALRDRLRVAPGERVRLADHDPDDTLGHHKDDARPIMRRGLERLTDLQERIWAEGRHAVLIVLQGTDTAGKDGAIGHVMAAFNPQGCTVTAFKVPTPDEQAHDYLWRVHRVTPARGTIGIFNRSHYEDVLVVRVHGLVPRPVWRRRYREINAFEQLLAGSATTIIKFFLHISPDEQRERLQARLDDPAKRWKFQLGDLDERRLWPAYTAAYEEALSRCSTADAPWYVVPADHKWFRDLAVAEIVGETLADLDPRYPAPEADLEGLTVV